MQNLRQISFVSVTQNYKDRSTPSTKDQHQTKFTSTNSNGKNYD